jgi:hypothetical protein
MAMLAVDAHLYDAPRHDATRGRAARLDVTVEQVPPHVAVDLDTRDVGPTAGAVRPRDVSAVADLPAASRVERRAREGDCSGSGRHDLGVVNEEVGLLMTEGRSPSRTG